MWNACTLASTATGVEILVLVTSVPLFTQGHPACHLPGRAHGEEALPPEVAQELFPPRLRHSDGEYRLCSSEMFGRMCQQQSVPDSGQRSVCGLWSCPPPLTRKERGACYSLGKLSAGEGLDPGAAFLGWLSPAKSRILGVI